MVIRRYKEQKSLTVIQGLRNTLPVSAYPSLEIEPTGGSNQWATTRAQRPRYQFKCVFTVMNDNESKSVEYIGTVVTRIVEIMTSPENLQLQVLNETKWDANGGMSATYILDSLVEDVTYDAVKEGSLRTAEFTWFALIHEPYPDSKFAIGVDNTPTVLRPVVIAAA